LISLSDYNIYKLNPSSMLQPVGKMPISKTNDGSKSVPPMLIITIITPSLAKDLLRTYQLFTKNSLIKIGNFELNHSKFGGKYIELSTERTGSWRRVFLCYPGM
jgi:hypothetical protein